MAKRVVVKPGDIFCIELEDNTKCYFQNLGKDVEQLNSNVICVFKKIYSQEAIPTCEDIVQDEVNFYAHTYIKWWVKDSDWIKVGKATIYKKMENLYFKTFDREDGWIEWRVWKVNHRARFYKNTFSKKLYQKCEWGEAFPDIDIVSKITKGYFAKYMDDMDKEYQNRPDDIGILSFLNIFKKK